MQFLQIKSTQDWRKEFWTGVAKFYVKDIFSTKIRKGIFWTDLWIVFEKLGRGAGEGRGQLPPLPNTPVDLDAPKDISVFQDCSL